MEVTDIESVSPSASVGAPIENDPAVSSVKLKVKSAPKLGLLFVLAGGGGVGVDPPPPPLPAPHTAQCRRRL